MKKLQFFSIRHSFSTPKGQCYADLAENDIKQAVSVKRVFSPRFANNHFKKIKVN